MPREGYGKRTQIMVRVPVDMIDEVDRAVTATGLDRGSVLLKTFCESRGLDLPWWLQAEQQNNMELQLLEDKNAS